MKGKSLMRSFFLTERNRKMIMDRPSTILQGPALSAGAGDLLP
jgi:hypothetical protein